jgi:ribosomal protein L37AE/L43A
MSHDNAVVAACCAKKLQDKGMEIECDEMGKTTEKRVMQASWKCSKSVVKISGGVRRTRCFLFTDNKTNKTESNVRVDVAAASKKLKRFPLPGKGMTHFH